MQEGVEKVEVEELKKYSFVMIYVFTEFVVAVIHSCALFSFMSKLIGNDQILAMNFW